MNAVLQASQVNTGAYTLERVRMPWRGNETIADFEQRSAISDPVADLAIQGLWNAFYEQPNQLHQISVPEDQSPAAFTYRVGRRALKIHTPSIMVVELEAATSCEESGMRAGIVLDQYGKDHPAGIILALEQEGFEWQEDDIVHEQLRKTLEGISLPVASLPFSPALRALDGMHAALLQDGPGPLSPTLAEQLQRAS